MDEALIKYLTIEVEGEVVTLFQIASLPDGARFEMIEAAINSNPVLRLVDKASVGDTWDGNGYTNPS